MFTNRKMVSARSGAIIVSVVALGVAACGPSKQVREHMAQLEQASAQKDSLLLEVSDLGRFISDVGAELAGVRLDSAKYRVASESPIQASRDSILEKIKYLNAMIGEGQARLARAQRRVRSLSHVADSLTTIINQTIQNYEETLVAQQARIADLSARLDTLTTANTRLAATVDTLTSAVDTLTTERNTVYYVVGTKQELLDKGVVQEEGGGRFLYLFWRHGRTLVPARDLSPSQFTAIDKYAVTQIPLPDSSTEYRIASRQPLDALADSTGIGGVVRGAVQIKEPDRFWKPSKFLIIVRKS